MSADFLAEAVQRWPRRVALTDADRSWSYRQLDEWVSDIADRLHQDDGPEEGDVLALSMDPTPEGIALLFAAWRAGLTVAPLNPRLTEVEQEAAMQALGGVRPEGHAVLWTSGTGGTPRGVVLSADNLRASAASAAERLGLSASDRWLASLSVAHIGGLAMVTRSVLLGCELVAVGAFDVRVAATLIDGGEVSHAAFVPTQLLRVLDARHGGSPPRPFRCALIGGAHAPADLVSRAVGEGWPLALTYGMTEMSSQVATAPPALVKEKPGTVGPPLSGVELKITDVGEIVVRGPTRSIGFVGGATGHSDEDGWYHTGDIGRLDGDGHLWITGRRSERIVTGGVTVDPFEVEEVLRRHPGVAEVCVVGVRDPEWGERVAAAIVPAASGFDPEELDRHARQLLSPSKRPRRWMRVEALPHNPNGKVDRDAVRGMLTAH